MKYTKFKTIDKKLDASEAKVRNKIRADKILRVSSDALN